MNNNGFSTLIGLCYLLPMVFLMMSFFLLSTNDQRTDLLATNGVKAQYLAESAVEKALVYLCADKERYINIRQEAINNIGSYEKELFSEKKEEAGHTENAVTYMHFYNYTDIVFTLTGIAQFDNAEKLVTAFIKEDNGELRIIRWDYHEQMP